MQGTFGWLMSKVIVRSFSAFPILITLYLTGCRAKRTKIWALGVSPWYMQRYFWLFNIQGHFGVIWCISNFCYFRPACTCMSETASRYISKTAGNKSKLTQIWAAGVLTLCMRYFWLLRFQSQSEVIRYSSEISDFQEPCILKTTHQLAKRAHIWSSGVHT